MHSFIRIIKSGFSSFIRNGWLSVASITVMVLTLLTLSIFFILNIVLNTGINSLQEKIDISVYFKDDVKQSSIIDIQNDLAKMKEVRSIKYTSAQDAINIFKDQHKNDPTILESIKDPSFTLPSSLEIKVFNTTKIDQITTILEQDKYKDSIEKITDPKTKLMIDTLFKTTNLTRKIGVIITIAFTLVSLVIIFNTVRIAIFARMEEIEIMKLVGATPGFIKGPFLFEGLLYGVISTIISMIILSSILYFSAPAIANYMGKISDMSDQITGFLRDNIFQVLLIQLCVGITIGVFSSWLAIRKHLRFA
jgi:cell division transport system permease protein